MNIESTKYVKDLFDETKLTIDAVIDGKTYHIPLDPDNRHYAEILKQVEAKTLTIKDAD